MSTPLPPCGSSNLAEFGNFVMVNALAAVKASIIAFGLDEPEQILALSGTSLPVQDVCENGPLMWTRIASVHPTDGSGVPFTQARMAWGEVPAFAYIIDIGIIACRSNIEVDGSAIDPDEETGYAIRDGNYRLALWDGLLNRLAPIVELCALGASFSPWTPIGPDGGISGGFIQITVIGSLATTGQCA